MITTVLSSVTKKMTEDFPIKNCVCCLSSDVYLSMLEGDSFSTFELITGFNLKNPSFETEKRICYPCKHFLKRVNIFREMCIEADVALRKGSAKIDLNHKGLSTKWRHATLSYSNICLVGIETSENDLAGKSELGVQCLTFGDASQSTGQSPLASRQIKIEESDGETWSSGEAICGNGDSDDCKLDQNVNQADASLRKWKLRSDNGKYRKTTHRDSLAHSKRIDTVYSDVKLENISSIEQQSKCDLGGGTLADGDESGDHFGKCKRNVSNNKIKATRQRSGTKCETCGMQFEQPCHLKRHSIIHTNLRPYPCQICYKTFRRKADVRKHVLVHTGVKTHMCHVCGQKFAALGNLRVHTLHKHSSEKAFQCSTCTKTFKTGTELKRHVRIHTGERPFHCDVCLQTFALAATLKTHRRTHTGEKPYVCDLCGSAFADQSYLKKHKRIHTGEKPYPCDTCSQSFSTACGRKTHSAIHSLVKPFSCDQCSYCTSRSGHLKRHKKTHKSKAAT